MVTPPDDVSPFAYLGILGGTGLTAWVGLTTVGHIAPGETVLITAAGGAVGTAAGHIARQLGAGRIIGVTGSQEKAERLLAGPFDRVINYREENLLQALAGADVDLALEGVGGSQLGAAIEGSKERGGRICWVGAVAQYNHLTQPPAAPANLFDIVGQRVRLEGHLVRSHTEERPAFEQFMEPLAQSGRYLSTRR